MDGVVKKNRIEWIDNAKGFGMLLIVWGHCFVPMNLKIWMYSFHVPLFFFMSGYLYKKRGIKETLQVKSRTLLLPYVFFALISFPVGFIYDKGFGIESTFIDHIYQLFYLNGSIGWNGPIWFFVVLFFVELIYSVFSNSKINDWVTALSFFIVGYFVYSYKIILPFGIHIAFWCIIFFIVGKKIKEYELFSRFTNYKYLMMLIFLVLNLIFAFVNTDTAEIYHSRLGFYPIFFIAAFSGILFVICLFLNSRKIKALQILSKKSVLIMGTHYYLLFFLRIVDKFLFNNYLFSMQLIPSIINAAFIIIVYMAFDYIKEKHRLKISTKN